MALIQCPECSAQVSTSALMCLSCGFPISKLRGLSVAIVLKDLEMVSDLIQLGADVNGLDKNGHTPLMNAASFGNIQIVQMLLDSGAEPAFLNDTGETAFTIATIKGDVEIEEILRKALDSKVPPTQEDETKEAEVSAGLNLEESFLHSNESEQKVYEPAITADSNVEVLSVPVNEEDQEVEETITTDENIEGQTITVSESDQKTEEIIIPAEIPLTIVESQLESEDSITRRFKIVSPSLAIGESEEVAIESRKQSEALNCLECGGLIGPDEMKCSHCLSLIMRRYCSHCSKLIPDHSTICPLCGENVTEHFLYASSRRGKFLIGATVAVLVILLLLIVHWRSNSQEEVRSLPASRIDPEAEKNFRPPIQTPKQNQATKPNDANDNRTEGNEIKQLAEKESIDSAPPATEPKSEPSNTDPSNSSLSASTQRALELTNQQRIKRGRYLNSKGYSLIQQGRPAEAVPLLEQSVRSFPQGTTDAHYAYALFNLGHALRIAGRPDLAIPILEERIKINNQRDAVARELLAAKQQARNSDSHEPDYE